MIIRQWLRTSALVLTCLASFASAPALAQDKGLVRLAAADGAARTEANTLNPMVSVRDSVIRVSDIFNGPIPRGDRAILAAPEPGERTVLDAELLARVARAYGLDWHPVSRDIRSIVKRESQTLSHTELLTELRYALEIEGAPEQAEIITSTPNLGLSLPVGATPAITISNVQYNAKGRRFTAMIDVSATEDDRVVYTRQLPVGGRVFATERVPVLTETINRGEIIQPEHVVYVSMRTDSVRDGAITNIRELVGKQARRQIRDGAPIRASQVQTPILVNRGDYVVIYYALRTMNLTAKGKALDAGGQGDVIRVMNDKSNRVLMAKVVQPNQVVVDTTMETAQR